MSRRSGIYVLLDILKTFAKEGRKVRTLLIGSPDREDMDNIKSVISEANIENDVTITGRIPFIKVRNVLTQAKIGLVLLLDCPKFHNNIAY